jgi:hypothetical protein
VISAITAATTAAALKVNAAGVLSRKIGAMARLWQAVCWLREQLMSADGEKKWGQQC